MTGRQTLYGRSLIRSANSMVNLNKESSTKHWEKTWFNPPKKQDVNDPSTSFLPPGISSGDNTTSNSTPQPMTNAVCSFELKSWVLTEDSEESQNEIEHPQDFLDLSQFLYEAQSKTVERTQNGKKTNGLSEADIRGAVGGDMIEFSNSAAANLKTAEKEDAPAVELENEAVQTENVQKQQSGSPSSISGASGMADTLKEENDVEGDVKMD